MTNIERARTTKHRSSPDTLDLWPAMVGGRISLVERINGGRRFYFAVDNAPHTRDLRAFTRREMAVIVHAARGLSSKLIGYALGISVCRTSRSRA